MGADTFADSGKRRGHTYPYARAAVMFSLLATKVQERQPDLIIIAKADNHIADAPHERPILSQSPLVDPSVNNHESICGHSWSGPWHMIESKP